MTLTLGTDRITVPLRQVPKDCLLELSERDKLTMVIELLMKDFRTGPNVTDVSNSTSTVSQ